SNAGLNNMGILNTIIGSNAGKNFRGTNNVFIGSNAGGFADFVGLDDSDDSVQWEEVSNNVAIGYNALHSLRAFTDLGELKSIPYNEEVGCLPEEDILGDRCVMRKEIYKHYNNNIAIGAYALENLEAGYNNVAIGYKACSNLYHSANKICIGANSGPGYDRGVTRFFESFKNADGNNHYITPTKKETVNTHLYDITQRIYIGSQPKHFGGDAVLEIHDSNVQYGAGNLKSFLMNEPTISRANTTTIVNGNLVVRGKVFFTVGDNLYNFSTVGYKPTADPPAGPGPRPRYPFDEQDYYILGSTVNEGSIVCAANPLTYTFGGVYNNGVYYSDNFSLGCPRVFYNQDQFDEIPDDYNDFTVTHDDTPVALGYKYLEKTYETPSDRRLKNIGSKSKAGLAEIMKLKVFNYKYKDDEKKIPHVGVIAQDLMKIFPNSVITGKDGFLSIKLEEMFYAAINAIKDLDKIIVSHTKRVLKLESTISKLEAENADLKSQVEALTTRVNKIKASRGL
ncbi:tail fiber domain-containing protein, partial [bacterium]|nr:tail fiber domain-containing protein [bacterium]